MGVFDVVLGVLRNDKSVDIEVVNQLVYTLNAADITFYIVIDEAIDLSDSCESLRLNTKITSSLTSRAVLKVLILVIKY